MSGSREVNDTQAIVSECNAALSSVEVAAIVGATVRNCLGHRDQVRIVAGYAVFEEPTANATHNLIFLTGHRAPQDSQPGTHYFADLTKAASLVKQALAKRSRLSP